MAVPNAFQQITPGLFNIQRQTGMAGPIGPGLGIHGPKDVFRGGGNNNGSVLGIGAGGGGGQPQVQSQGQGSTTNLNLNDVLQDTGGGGQGTIDINSLLQPALDAVGQFEATLQPGADLQTREAEAGSSRRTEGARADEASKLQSLGGERTRATRQGESAVAESRRLASQSLQGLQSLFGGSTGTGGFAGEQLLSSASRNIGQNRAVMQETLGKIGQAETSIRDETSRLVKEFEDNLQFQKDQIQQNLQEALAGVASRRGELQARKAELNINLLEQANASIRDIEARNAQFKQQLFLQQQDAQQKLETMRANVVDKSQFNPDFENLQTFKIGDTNFGAIPTSRGGFDIQRGSTDEDEDNLSSQVSLG